MAAALLGQSLVERFREPDTPYLSPTRVGEFFGLRVQELAERAHVHRNTPTARPQAPLLQKYLQDMVRVLAVATEMTGDAVDDEATALAKYKQDYPWLPPGTICTFLVRGLRVADLSGGFDPTTGQPCGLISR